MHPTKQFTNNAPQPIFVAVTAHVDDRGSVTSVYTAGSTAGFDEIQRAEQRRMFKWIRATFVGQTERFFNAHNGIVPHEEIPLPDAAGRFFNTSGSVSPLHFDQRERRFSLADVDAEEVENRVYAAIAAMLGLSDEPPEVGHDEFDDVPNVGTYWQDRERPVRFFFLLSKHECEGHTHMRMLRVDHARGGEYDFVFVDSDAWDKQFKRVAQVDVPGNIVTGRTVVLMDRGECKVSFDGLDVTPARDLTDDQINTVVAEHGERYSGLREFLEEQRPQRRIEFPAALGEPYVPSKGGILLDDEPDAYAKVAADYGSVQYRSALGEPYNPTVDGVPKYMQQFLDALDFTGNEVPPAVGERYFSWISGSTYKVVDVSRKLRQTDHYVTMEREHDGHRAKYTFRDHAHWLAVWRPVDDEGSARPVEMVDVPTTTLDLTGPTSAESDAERRLSVIYRELDRKVPGWREAGDGDWVFLDDTALALRAIRTLSKHMRNYRQLGEQLGRELASAQEHTGEQLKAINTTNKRHSAQMRDATDRMREMAVVFAEMFAELFGREALKEQIVAMNATSVANLPHDQLVPFLKRCRDYGRRKSEG